MMQIDNFSLKDIIISEDFKQNTPAASKLERVRKYFSDRGEIPAEIVLNEDNVLIDGYCTYLLAQELGLKEVPIERGHIELIEAYHRKGQQSYFWRVPAKLMGRIVPGSKCIVRTERGIRRVTVINILQQQYPTQSPRLKNVLRVS